MTLPPLEAEAEYGPETLARRSRTLEGYKAGVAGMGAHPGDFADPHFFDGYRNGNLARADFESELQLIRDIPAVPAPDAPPDAIISDTEGVRIYHGDALRVLRGMEPHSVDVFMCDPPYSRGGMFRGDRTPSTSSKYVQTGQAQQWPEFDGDSRDQRAYLTWSTLWISEALRVCKPAGLMCLFTDWRQIGVTIDALQCGGFIYRGLVPWDKTQAARPRKGAFRSQCEYLVWGSNGAMLDTGPCHPGAFTFSVAGSEKHHVAGKPEGLMQELVKICPPGGVVCDLFAGSGTTLKAAKVMGRRAIGVDKNAGWAAKCVDRTRENVLISPEQTAPVPTPEPELFPS